jgi:hypothetical protein
MIHDYSYAARSQRDNNEETMNQTYHRIAQIQALLVRAQDAHDRHRRTAKTMRARWGAYRPTTPVDAGNPDMGRWDDRQAHRYYDIICRCEERLDAFTEQTGARRAA